MKLVRIAAGLVPALALGVVLAQPITASAEDVPCADQQVRVDRAEAALARVTAVFERQKDKVDNAEEALAAAETRVERAEAKAALQKARERKAAAAAEKRAQKIRLAKATERLEACLAG
jgi:predicted ribosome quality control (RQC) complex YloA/Tae2 family protein